MNQSQNDSIRTQHSYWGIAFILSLAGVIGCVCWILFGDIVWPDTIAPVLLFTLFLILTVLCVGRILDKGAEK